MQARQRAAIKKMTGYEFKPEAKRERDSAKYQASARPSRIRRLQQ
jgi:hypothetical protein